MSQIHGTWCRYNLGAAENILNIIVARSLTEPDEDELSNLNRKGKYRSLEFNCNHTVSVITLKFFNHDKFSREHKNNVFVGDTMCGNLRHFDLKSQN